MMGHLGVRIGPRWLGVYRRSADCVISHLKWVNTIDVVDMLFLHPKDYLPIKSQVPYDFDHVLPWSSKVM
jgi:hypothetical protein